MQTIEQFIDALGGTSAVAKALKLTPSTVSSWKTSDSVPEWRRDKLIRLANRKAVPLPTSFSQDRAA